MADKSAPSSKCVWQTEVVVVGAGPAGSAAAIEACRRGLSVVVVDKARFPREKCCGDGLTTEALRQLDALGFDPGRVPSWVPVGDVHLRSPKGRTVHLPLPPPAGAFAAVCRRSELDQALVKLARCSGATVLEGHELTELDVSESSVRVVAGDTELSASYVIAADGMWSPTRKLLQLGPTGYRGEWHAFRQYFTDVSDRAGGEMAVWFEQDLLPGYGWSFPIAGGVANVGFGIQRGRGTTIQDMKALWPELLSRPHIAAWLGPDARPESPHRSWPIPARLGSSPLTSGRVLFVGDAAAATDPMTGEGIGQALETGRAAVAAIAAGDRPDSVAARYHEQLSRGMTRDHGLARSLSRVLARAAPTELTLRAVNLSDWSRRNVGRWLFEDYPRAALFTPHRWRRHLFGSDGVTFTNRSNDEIRHPA